MLPAGRQQHQKAQPHGQRVHHNGGAGGANGTFERSQFVAVHAQLRPQARHEMDVRIDAQTDGHRSDHGGEGIQPDAQRSHDCKVHQDRDRNGRHGKHAPQRRAVDHRKQDDHEKQGGQQALHLSRGQFFLHALEHRRQTGLPHLPGHLPRDGVGLAGQQRFRHRRVQIEPRGVDLPQGALQVASQIRVAARVRGQRLLQRREHRRDSRLGNGLRHLCGHGFGQKLRVFLRQSARRGLKDGANGPGLYCRVVGQGGGHAPGKALDHGRRQRGFGLFAAQIASHGVAYACPRVRVDTGVQGALHQRVQPLSRQFQAVLAQIQLQVAHDFLRPQRLQALPGPAIQPGQFHHGDGVGQGSQKRVDAVDRRHQGAGVPGAEPGLQQPLLLPLCHHLLQHLFSLDQKPQVGHAVPGFRHSEAVVHHVVHFRQHAGDGLRLAHQRHGFQPALDVAHLSQYRRFFQVTVH